MCDESTRKSLLVRLRDPSDLAAWASFVEIYQPLIYRFARRRGLKREDAHDVCQEVLTAVNRKIPAWDLDSRKGSFRAWLFVTTRNWSLKIIKGAHPGQQNDDVIKAIPCRDEAEKEFGVEYRRRLFHWAAGVVRPRCTDNTWQAFWLTAVDELPVKEVAERLGMTEVAVYIARSRVMDRIRRLVREVDLDEFDDLDEVRDAS